MGVAGTAKRASPSRPGEEKGQSPTLRELKRATREPGSGGEIRV